MSSTVGVQHTTEGTPPTRAAARSKRTIGEDTVPVRGHSNEHVPEDYRTINGWAPTSTRRIAPHFQRSFRRTSRRCTGT